MILFRLLIIYFYFIGCSVKKDVEIKDVIIDTETQQVIVEIKNNTENNYYLISPQLVIYIKNGVLNTIKTEVIEETVNDEKIDSIICAVYEMNTTCEEGENHDILLLPRESIKKIKYKYHNYNNHSIYHYSFFFLYDGYRNEETKEKYLLLKKKLDSVDIIKGYEFYNKEVKKEDGFLKEEERNASDLLIEWE